MSNRRRKRYITSTLFTTPTLLTGAANAFNLAGNFYKFYYPETGFEADRLALENDFNMIGQDFYDVFKKVSLKNKGLTLAD